MFVSHLIFRRIVRCGWRALLVLLVACAADPHIDAHYPAGAPVGEVLRDLTRTKPHLYVYAEEAALRQRLSVGLYGNMTMSRFVDAAGKSAGLRMTYSPYEPGSPRGTLRVRLVGSSSSGGFVIIARGVQRPAQ